MKFVSPFHNRFEQGIFKEKSETQRNILLSFSENEKLMDVVIEPTLTTKSSKFLKSEKYPNEWVGYYYEGLDKDYLFTLIRDKNGRLIQFILNRLDMELSIVYPIQ